MLLKKIIQILILIIIFGLILSSLTWLITGKSIIAFTKHWLASVTQLILVISPSPCGNNIVEPGEECDGSDFRGQTCLNFGFTGGILKCNLDCTFNLSQCTTALPAAVPIVPGPIIEIPPKKIPLPPEKIPAIPEEIPPEKIVEIPPPEEILPEKIIEVPAEKPEPQPVTEPVIEWPTGGAIDVVTGISGLVAWSASALIPIIPGPPELPQTIDETPTFRGISSIPFAIIFLELTSDPIFGKTQADELGYWTWTCPKPLSLGIHTLKITAQDPKDPAKKITSFQKFKLTTKEDVKKTEKILFDISLIIQPKYKKVYPGDDLLVLVEIIKHEPKGRINIPLHYQIRDEKDEIILDYTETMVIERQLSFLKTFHITDKIKLGKYKIYLEIHYNNTFVSSFDSFEIIKRPLFIIPGVITLIKKEISRELGLIFGIFLIGLAIFVIFLYRKFVLTRKIRKINPDDLREKKFTKADEEKDKEL